MHLSLTFIFCLCICIVYGQEANRAPDAQNTLQLHLNYYDQDGIHSAVTGGKGSEDLQVIASKVVMYLAPDSIKWYDLELGVDVISSASTDSIDFNVSSASKKDGRVHVRFGYGRNIGNQWAVGLNASGSVESDYLSTGLGFSMNKTFNSMQALEMKGQFYFDDLRWGWYQEARGIRLIYPQELRGTEWFDEYKRNTCAFSLTWNQIINKRLQMSIIGDFIYQEGLLSTPFHRVYFTDQLTPNVELLPNSRLKFPMALRINYQTPLDLAIRSYYRFYTDDFEIQAHTASIELPYQFHMNWSISPYYRYYSQSGASFFRPFANHVSTSMYYSSDYDYSSFTSHEFGLGLRHRIIPPNLPKGVRRYQIFGIGLRYGHYSRSDELSAHFISVLFNFAKP